MKSLVVYSSQTGNTKKLAQAVYDALEGEKELFSLEDAPDPNAYDFIAAGFWLMAGKPDPKSSEYLAQIKDRSLFLFATHGAAKGSDHAENAMNHAKAIADQVKIVGTFSCQGEVNPKILAKVKAKPQPPVWLSDADDAVGHPDDDDIKALKNQVIGIK